MNRNDERSQVEDQSVLPRPEWNRGGGDHDSLYVFGHTDLYLCEQERARLLLVRAGVRKGKFADDTRLSPA